jgi:hypothetical protein
MKSIKTAAKKILGTLLGQDLLGRIGSRKPPWPEEQGKAQNLQGQTQK